jgi:hypothetical protein
MLRFFAKGALALALVAGLSFQPLWAAHGHGGGGGGHMGGGHMGGGHMGGFSGGHHMGGMSMGGMHRSMGGMSMRSGPSMHSAPMMRSAPSMNRGPTVMRSPTVNRAPAMVNRAPATINRAPAVTRGNLQPNIGRQGVAGPRVQSNNVAPRVHAVNPGSIQANAHAHASAAGRAVQGNLAPRLNGTPNNVARTHIGQVNNGLRANSGITAHRPVSGHLANAANIGAAHAHRPTPNSINQHLGLRGNNALASASNSISARSHNPGNAGAGNIHHRANWQQSNNANLGRVHNNLAGAVRNTNHNTYLANHPQRAQQWNNWANNAHNHWNHHRGQYFNNRWWATHYVNRPRYFNYFGFGLGGFGYGYPYYGGLGGFGFGYPYYGGLGGFGFGYPYYGYGGYGLGGFGLGYRPWSYWWGSPTWGGINSWGGYGWSSPCYYDYGAGGNIVYSNGGVYLNDQLLGTPQDYAQSAADLATVNPDTISDQAGDWMALGTFAMVTDKGDADPSRVIQLAIDKQGVVSGTMYNKKTDKAYAVSGRVDKETQRVAFRIDDAPDLVFETGIYNLTQNETPVLVHTGPDTTDTLVLARLTPPDNIDDGPATDKPLEKLLP